MKKTLATLMAVVMVLSVFPAGIVSTSAVNPDYSAIYKAQLEDALADYTQLNLLIAQAETLNRVIYTADSLVAVDAALDIAYDVVAAGYESSMQEIVDEMAANLENALSELEYVDTDFTVIEHIWANKPDLSNYTDESVANLVDYYNSIPWNDPFFDPIECEQTLMTLIHALVLKPADYDAVDDAISAIPDNDVGDLAVDWDYLYSAYTNASVTNLANAVNAIVYGKNITEQAVVNGYATAVNAARLALVSLGADYTYLGIALNNAPLWPSSYYTDATYMPYNNALAVGWVIFDNQNLNILQQDIINNVILLINSTYEALENKDVTYTVKYQTTDGTMITSDVVKNAKAAEWITETAPAIIGYTATQATIQKQMTGTNAENVIIFTYTVNSYTITFALNDGTGGIFRTYDLPSGTMVYFYPDYSGFPPFPEFVIRIVYPPGFSGGFEPQIIYSPPTRQGYTFLGWSCGMQIQVTQDETINAVWDANDPVTITFDADGGTGGTIIQLMPGEDIIPPAVAKTGFIFEGWSPTVPASVGADDVTYTAQWRTVGDMSGDGAITSVDALMALQASAGNVSPTDIQILAADVDKNGTVTSLDALMILQYSAGLITSF